MVSNWKLVDLPQHVNSCDRFLFMSGDRLFLWNGNCLTSLEVDVAKNVPLPPAATAPAHTRCRSLCVLDLFNCWKYVNITFCVYPAQQFLNGNSVTFPLAPSFTPSHHLCVVFTSCSCIYGSSLLCAALTAQALRSCSRIDDRSSSRVRWRRFCWASSCWGLPASIVGYKLCLLTGLRLVSALAAVVLRSCVRRSLSLHYILHVSLLLLV